MDGEDWLGIFTALVGVFMIVQPRRSTRYCIRYAFSDTPALYRFRPVRFVSYLLVFIIGVGIVYASLVGMGE